MALDSLEDLQDLVRQGEMNWTQYGDVATKTKDGLILFNYTLGATMSHRWNWFERVSRGLILHQQTGEVVGRGFDKFFNYGEQYDGIPIPRDTEVQLITEKMDGSLGILYRPLKGGYAIATRGAFDSDQAQWATAHLAQFHPLDAVLPPECSLLFEIIYPENRIVVDYGDQKMLVLLAARNIHTGAYFDEAFVDGIANIYHFPRPQVYQMPQDAKAIAEMVSAWDCNTEGVVAQFDDGSRWKFKAESYVKVSRLLMRLAPRRILQAVQDGTMDDILPLLPLHIQREVVKLLDEIAATHARIRHDMQAIFQELVPCPRAEFAEWVLTFHQDVAHYLFRLYLGQDLEPDIFKYEFEHFKGRMVIPGLGELD